MSGLERMVERQILKALAEGKLTGLEGEGKPLPERPEAALVDPAIAAGFRIMAEAGALPEEIVQKKAAAALRERLAQETDEARRKALMTELAEVELKRAIAEEARRRFMR